MRLKKYNFLRYSSMIIVVGLVLAYAFISYQSYIMKQVETDGKFAESVLANDTDNIVDLGVVDFNDDGNIDIFTSNHNHRQLIFHNGGNGRFTDVLTLTGLSQQREFPGLEMANNDPFGGRPGVYIYWHNTDLIIRWEPGSGITAPSGVVKFSCLIRSLSGEGFMTSASEVTLDTKATLTTLNFNAHKPGILRIKPRYYSIPFNFEMSEGISPKDIFIGHERVNPDSGKFTLYLADRHGMAWADYDGDSLMDVFIVRGGIHGHMNRLPEIFMDELFRKEGQKYINMSEGSGMSKGTCPGYQVHWLDYDRDDDLDLYISCQRKYPNQFYRNEGSGQFSDVADSSGLAITENPFDTAYLWIDVDQNGTMDLMVGENTGLETYVNKEGTFERDESRRIPDIKSPKLTVSDYDNDGDLDIFAVSISDHNKLLVNKDGTFISMRAVEVGLPDHALTANWVDYDNDGLVDIHMVPGGLYQQQSDHKFKATGLLLHKSAWAIKEVRSSWVDLDNDGDRDLVMAAHYDEHYIEDMYYKLTGQERKIWGRMPLPWFVRVFTNRVNEEDTKNQWLEVVLKGQQGNAQSIGTLVILNQDVGITMAQVGQSDGSHFSQGHYRLYFGLGQNKRKLSLRVIWPDGSEQFIGKVEPNEILEIRQN